MRYRCGYIGTPRPRLASLSVAVEDDQALTQPLGDVDEVVAVDGPNNGHAGTQPVTLAVTCMRRSYTTPSFCNRA